MAATCLTAAAAAPTRAVLQPAPSPRASSQQPAVPSITAPSRRSGRSQHAISHSACESVSSSRPSHQSARPSWQTGAAAADSNGGATGASFGERIVLSEFPEEAAEGEMAIKLECDESGCVLVVGKDARKPDAEEVVGRLQCNLAGCFYSTAPATNEFKVLEGSGWRLGYETVPDSEDSFSAMVGAGGWSVALTAQEFDDFCKLVQMLRKGIITMDQDGVLGKDDIVMQVERGSLWMECVVPRKRLPSLQRFLKFGASRSDTSAFEIRFILSGQDSRRQAEGYWPAEAVMDMLKRIDETTDTPAPTPQVAVAKSKSSEGSSVAVEASA